MTEYPIMTNVACGGTAAPHVCQLAFGKLRPRNPTCPGDRNRRLLEAAGKLATVCEGPDAWWPLIDEAVEAYRAIEAEAAEEPVEMEGNVHLRALGEILNLCSGLWMEDAISDDPFAKALNRHNQTIRDIKKVAQEALNA